MKAEGESDMGLALNRYIGNSIIPLLTKYSRFYADADSHSPLLEATLHTVYRMSKGKMLTNVQRQAVYDFLIAITNEVPPGMLLKLLRQLTVDLAKLNEYSNVALRVSRVMYVLGEPLSKATEHAPLALSLNSIHWIKKHLRNQEAGRIIG